MRNDILAASAAVVLLAACQSGQPPARGGDAMRADSTRASAAATSSGALLAYVTNEDSQELTVIDTRTDSAIATFPVGTRPRGVDAAADSATAIMSHGPATTPESGVRHQPR